MTADDLSTVVGVRPLDAATAVEVADQLRAIVVSLSPINRRDAHLCVLVTKAAELVEFQAGIS